MIGLSVSVRLRMSSHDAHYAGELVDGARMLGLFGDLATELLIRLDGDEGLFRAYDTVEFLAPVFAGDYIEATATLVSVGKTSRKIQFEARKVITNLRVANTPASAADVLSEPLVVCRASGTCVTPLELQRHVDRRSALSQNTEKVILTAAIVGAEVTRAHTPYLPITPEEIAIEAVKCREKGAAIIHLHVRKEDGSPTQDKAYFEAAISAIKSKTDCIVQTSTGGAIGMSIEERAQPLLCKPEMATLSCGSLNFGDEVFVNTRAQIRDLATKMKSASIKAELECYDVGNVEEAVKLSEEGLLLGSMHVQFVLGIPGAISATENNVKYMKSLLPTNATFSVAAVGRFQKPMTELAMRLGGHARVGLEDNIYLDKGVLAEGSSPLVARAKEYALSIGRAPATPSEARKILGIV